MTGSLAYLWLEAKRQWRNREVLIFRLGLPTGVYLILNVADGDTPTNQSGWEDGGHRRPRRRHLGAGGRTVPG
jgi:hypothetical protein